MPPKAVHQESVIFSTGSVRCSLVEQNLTDSPEERAPSVEGVAGVHFLSDGDNAVMVTAGGGGENAGEGGGGGGGENGENYEKKKNELYEYMIRHDGSVVCKLCGEVLASRTHWYRHKYKLHVNSMSRKGYMGHVSTRHSENIEQQEELNISIKEEVVETAAESPKVSRKKEIKSADWEEQRVKEEKLVADIIDRVRKECEAQGAAVTRRGYSRRSTVMMNSCSN